MEPGWLIAAYGVATDAVGNREAAPTAPDLRLEVPAVVSVVRANPVELRWRAPEGSTWVVERTDRLGPQSQWRMVSDPIAVRQGAATFLDPPFRASAMGPDRKSYPQNASATRNLVSPSVMRRKPGLAAPLIRIRITQRPTRRSTE